MATGTKLAVAGLVIASVTAYMAYRGASGSWQYYVTVDECLTDAARFTQDRIRINGKIAAGSLQIAEDRRQASFAMEGTTGQLAVICAAPLPDKLAERIEVVVEGRLDDSHTLRAEKVLTRCASKYKAQGAAAPSTEKVGTKSEGGP